MLVYIKIYSVYMPDDCNKLSFINAENSDKAKSDSTRREVLQVAGTAGVSSFGIPLTAAVEQNDSEVSGVTFVELGVSFEHSMDVKHNDQYDPLEFYKIANDELMFSAIKQANLEIFRENTAVVRFDDFHGLSIMLTQRQYGSVWSELNTRLQPIRGTLLSGSVSTPAIRVESDDCDIIVAVDGTEARIAPNASKIIELGSVNSTTRDGDSINAMAKATVENHGPLDIVVNHVQGVD